SRPIRRAAGAARQLTAGDRSVRLEVAPPAEVAELSLALNGLAGALTESEGRQRDFLLSVSHELRTPLTAIRGYGEALADGVLPGSEAPAVRDAGRTVLAESARLDRLVSDLLALARLSAQDFSIEVVDVDLVDLANAAVSAWRHRCAEADVALRSELSDTPVPVRIDPGRLRQVLDGLLENAFRVVPAGAPLVVAVGRRPEGAVLEVRDGGPGLSDDDLANAFERGRLYQKYRGIRPVGSGLGLALAARLVARLGGRIEAGHAAEGGARFTVVLPPRVPADEPSGLDTTRTLT
ncbi:MAG: ATP-binding protein, partial [Actinocatenispora sp.]